MQTVKDITGCVHEQFVINIKPLVHFYGVQSYKGPPPLS